MIRLSPGLNNSNSSSVEICKTCKRGISCLANTAASLDDWMQASRERILGCSEKGTCSPYFSLAACSFSKMVGVSSQWVAMVVGACRKIFSSIASLSFNMLPVEDPIEISPRQSLRGQRINRLQVLVTGPQKEGVICHRVAMGNISFSSSFSMERVGGDTLGISKKWSLRLPPPPEFCGNTCFMGKSGSRNELGHQ